MQTVQDYLHIKLAQIAGMYQAPVFGTEQPGTSIGQDPMQQTLAQIGTYRTAQNNRVSRFKKMIKMRQNVNPNAANVLAPTPMVQQVENPTGDVSPETSVAKMAADSDPLSPQDYKNYHQMAARNYRAELRQRAEIRKRRAYLGGRTKGAGRAAKKSLLSDAAKTLKGNIGTANLPSFLGASDESVKNYQKQYWQNFHKKTPETSAALGKAQSAMNKSKWMRRGGLAAAGAGGYLAFRAIRNKVRKNFWGPPPEQQQPQQPQQPTTGTSGSGSWVNDQFGTGNSSQMPVVKTGARLERFSANIAGPDMIRGGRMVYRPRKLFLPKG
jgi:hypothetical protein